LGVVWGLHSVALAGRPVPACDSWASFMARWDGQHYGQIAVEGYSFDPDRPSNITFLPAYPLLARLVIWTTGWDAEAVLVALSHSCLAGTFVLLTAYASGRKSTKNANRIEYVLLAFGLWPTGCFFRMAYSESLFVLLTILALYGMQRRWSPLSLALIVGFASAARPVGVALLCPLVVHLWNRYQSHNTRLLALATTVPLAVWGLVAFLVFQWAVFGEPLAFLQTQVHWRMRPPTPLGTKLVALFTLEPIWSVYQSTSPSFWGRFDPNGVAVCSLQFANPIIYLFAVFLLILGVWRGWLTRVETAVAIPLLLMPYVTNSYDMCMSGMGRFTCVIFPLAFVLAELLARMPTALRTMYFVVSGTYVAIYCAGFATGARVI
jgi:hypothetical protein